MSTSQLLLPAVLALAAGSVAAQVPVSAQAPAPTNLADQLNRGLDQVFKRTPQSTPPEVGPATTLADDVNKGIDRLFWRQGRPPVASYPRPTTLGDQLNRQLDRLLSLRLGEAVLAVTDEVPDLATKAATTTVGAARAAALTGPVVFPEPVLQPVQGSVTTRTGLTLLQAWRQATANDAQLRAARAAQAAGRERLPQARAQLMPSLQYSASRFQNNVDRQGMNALNQPLSTFDRYASENQTLQLRQPILRAQLVAQLDQARAQVNEVDANMNREEQSMTVRLSVAYFEALLARDQVDLVLGQQRFLTAAVDAETKALRAGTGTRTAVDEAQARLDLNKAQELEARQAEAQARRQLQAYIQQPVGSLARLRPESMNLPALAAGDLQEWTNKALAQSPEVRAVQAQIEQARGELNKARSAHLPTLDLIAQAQRSRSENIISPQSQYESRGVGLQLNVPIYGGGYVNSVTRQASAELERAREQLQAIKEDLSVRVHREYRGVTEGQARIRGLEIALRSANVALESARRSQAAGVRTSIDVLNAEQQRQQVLRDLAQARYFALASAVRLHALTGNAQEGVVALVDSAFQAD